MKNKKIIIAMIAGALIGYASATFLNTENYGSYQNTLQKKRIASPTEEYINEVVKLIQADGACKVNCVTA